MILNITNGDYFDQYFHTVHQEASVPFREAMLTGTAISPIFSEAFIKHRASQLQTTVSHYQEQITPFLQAIPTSTRLQLWFGEDSFCQLNLLTLLAYLEQEGYGGEISLNLIDDASFSIKKEAIPVTLGGYREMYEAILISRKRTPVSGVICEKAIDLYFDYLSPNGRLAQIIKSNPHESDEQLLMRLITASEEYGLSDLQAMELIQKHRAKEPT